MYGSDYNGNLTPWDSCLMNYFNYFNQHQNKLKHFALKGVSDVLPTSSVVFQCNVVPLFELQWKLF